MNPYFTHLEECSIEALDPGWIDCQHKGGERCHRCRDIKNNNSEVTGARI